MDSLFNLSPEDISQFYFAWPHAFWALLIVPFFWWAYVRYHRVQWQQAVRFSYASVAAYVRHQPPTWKKLLLPVVVTLVMLCQIVALARPTVVAEIPVRSADMMIVMDISISMLADDIRPDRITAAKEAGIRFVNSLPKDVRVGLELFAGDNYVMSPPTTHHEEVAAYLRNLRREDLKTRTEIGSALKTALKILETTEAQRLKDAEAKKEREKTSDAQTSGTDGDGSKKSAAPAADRPDQVIILLSDGDSHEGYPWQVAAEEARKQNVSIHSIAVGQKDYTTITWQGHTLDVLFSENTLRSISRISGGTFFRVYEREDFRKIYDSIRKKAVHTEERSVDLGFAASGLALVILTLGLLITGRWVRPFL